MMYDPTLPRSRVFLPAILSGILLYICFFPLNLGFLGWVALVPLLSLVHANARPRRIYFATFIGGLCCYVPAICWMSVAHPAMIAAWLFLAFCCALFLVMSLWLTRRLLRVGVPTWLAVPIAFVSIEYFRSHFPTGYTWLDMFGVRNPIGFGWYMLGHTQHDWSALIQVVDLTGVYGVSFIVAVVNTAIWLSVERNALLRVWLRHIKDPTPASLQPAVASIALLGAALLYGYLQLNHNPFAEGPEVALIQGNLPQDIKNEHGAEMEDHFGNLADEAAHPKDGNPVPDLIVWPETAFVVPWFDVAEGLSLRQLDQKFWVDDVLGELTPAQQRYWKFRRGLSNTRPEFMKASERRNVPTLFGLSGMQWEADEQSWRYNSALLLDRNGAYLGRYDKMHLVPLGEYVPMVETLPFMKMFTPYEADYSCKPGSMWTRFPLTVRGRTYHFACIICYEDTDASLARHYVRPGEEGVDFFVNISNDGWFHGTAEHEQHLAICRFRAIETRRSVVRAVNMGISAIIDPDGRVVTLPGPTWHESKSITGIVRGPVPIGTGTTLYARFGDWLPVACWFVLIGGFVRGFILRRRAKNAVAAR
jgi:apolipoprotein N-acyltransferase